MDERIPLHIVFGLSAAGSLREAIRVSGLPGEVIGLLDDLSCGPTDSADTKARLSFYYDDLGYDLDQCADEVAAFWRLALDASLPRIVWLSRWSAIEYCNFLSWLERNGDAPFDLVDLTETRLQSRSDPRILQPVGYTALVSADQFIQYGLWDRATTPSPDYLSAWKALWTRLRAENAPLRVIKPEGLVSAPITYFDADLISHASEDWTDVRFVIGKTLGAMMYDTFREGGVYQCGDMVLFSRVRALIEDGVLKKKGRLNSSTFKVRRV